MQIIKLSAGYMLVTSCGSVLFSDAGFNEESGNIELEKNNQRVFIVASSLSVEFEKAFIEAGGVIE